MEPSKLWSLYEVEANSYDDLHSYIVKISEAAAAAKRTLVWRGQKDASWALHSKLYRTYLEQKPDRINETSFAMLEQDVLKRLRRWGLHSQKTGGRLSVLSQLAMLQHFGSPTRLIDVTFNALVGAFFATEEDANFNNTEARLFAIDVTDRLINEKKTLRNWEDSLDTPWSPSFIAHQYYGENRDKIVTDSSDQLSKKQTSLAPEESYKKYWLNEWSTHFYAWRPPALDARIAAQNGGFIFGGVVASYMREGYLDPSNKKIAKSFQWKDPSFEKANLSIDDIRRISCLAVQPKIFPDSSIRANSKDSVYNIGITVKGKNSVRNNLRTIYGYTHATIYPDFSGFALYGQGVTGDLS